MLCPELFWSRYTGLWSQAQTPKLSKVLISGVSFHHRSLLHSHESNVLSYSEFKMTKVFWGFAPGPYWGSFTLPPDSPAAQRFFSSLCSLKNWHPPRKLLDMALIRSHSDVKLNCRIKYLNYVVITLILYWCNIRLAAINFQVLNLAIWFNIGIGLSVVHAAFGRFVNHIFAFHVSPVLDLIFALNWFELASSKLQHCWYLFDDEMMRQILTKTRKYIGKGNFTWFELQNK